MLEPLVMSIVFADFTVTLRIVDESRKAGISATFFADNTALLPCVKPSGDVISLHDVVVHHKTPFNYAICHWVFLGAINFHIPFYHPVRLSFLWLISRLMLFCCERKNTVSWLISMANTRVVV